MHTPGTPPGTSPSRTHACGRQTAGQRLPARCAGWRLVDSTFTVRASSSIIASPRCADTPHQSSLAAWYRLAQRRDYYLGMSPASIRFRLRSSSSTRARVASSYRRLSRPHLSRTARNDINVPLPAGVGPQNRNGSRGGSCRLCASPRPPERRPADHAAVYGDQQHAPSILLGMTGQPSWPICGRSPARYSRPGLFKPADSSRRRPPPARRRPYVRNK